MHAERLLWSIRVPGLMLIAQAVFRLERGQTDKQTDIQKRLNAMPASSCETPNASMRVGNGEGYLSPQLTRKSVGAS